MNRRIIGQVGVERGAKWVRVGALYSFDGFYAMTLSNVSGEAFVCKPKDDAPFIQGFICDPDDEAKIGRILCQDDEYGNAIYFGTIYGKVTDKKAFTIKLDEETENE